MTLGQHAIATKRVFWTPKDLGAPLTVWYDAGDAATVTLTSSKVSQIDDKSGNARHATQSTATNQPVISSAYQNSRDVLQFYADSTADWLSVPSTGVTAQPYTIFLSLQIANTNTAETMFMNSNDVTLEKSTRLFPYAGSGTSMALDRPTAWFIYGVTFNGGSSLSSLNGTTTSQTSGSTVISGATTYIGARTNSTSTNPYRSYIGEFLIVSGTLSTANRQRIEGYLAWKWGVASSLAAGHPYLAATP